MNQYLIQAWDGTDEEAMNRRMQARPLHFDRARELKATDNFVFGGAILNENDRMIGSIMVVQFETDEELKQWMDSEPYIAGKVWEKISVYPFKVANV